MSRDHSFYLLDMLEACNKIMSYSGNMSSSEFLNNTLIYDAVLRNLEVIGEAAKNIPNHVRILYPNIEWRKLCGLRDVIAHALN